MTDLVAREWDAAMERARDLRAEQSVLGGCLNQPTALDWLDLETEAFFDPRHQRLWAALQALRNRGVPVDPVTVSSALRANGGLLEVGGDAYLGELSLRCPITENLQAYADVVRGHHHLRRLVRLCACVPAMVQELESDAEQVHDAIQLGLSEVEPKRSTGAVPMSELVKRELRDAVEFAERAAKGGETAGVPTGIQVLDKQLGGIRVGVPTVLGARPADGKSTTALTFAVNATRAGYPTHLITLEDRAPVWGQRVLSHGSGIPVTEISARTFRPLDGSALVHGAEKAGDLSSLLVEHGHGMNVDRLCRMARARKRHLGTRLVVVDYVQLIPGRPHEKRWERQAQIRGAMETLAELAALENIALVICSQLRRPKSENAMPVLEDLLGSGAIEEIAKLVILLWPEREQGVMRMLVAKNSQGPTARLNASWQRSSCYLGD